MVSGIARHLQPERSYPRNFYRKTLIVSLFISSIPGLIVGLFIYFLVGKHIENQMQEIHQNQIIQKVGFIDDQFAHLELSTTHWAFDPSINDDLKNLDFSNNFSMMRDISKTLLIMEASDPLIHDVKLYVNGFSQGLFTLNGYYPLTDQNDIKEYKSLLLQKNSVYWTDLSQKQGSPTTLSPISFVNKIPGGSSTPFGVLVVTLDQNKVLQMLNTITPSDQGATFLLTQAGGWIVNGSKANPSDLESQIRTAVMKHQGSSGSFLLTWKNSTYSVSFVQFSRLGTSWNYVSAVPLTSITAPVVFTSMIIIWISLGGLLLAFFLSWLASRKLYTPIERLVRLLAVDKESQSQLVDQDEFDLIESKWHHLTKESLTLQSKLEQQLPHMKDGFILQLVQGYFFSLTENNLRDSMKHYGWEVQDKQFIALIIQLTGFSNLDGRFSPGDEGLVTYLAANIMDELRKDMQVDSVVINFHDLSIGLLAMVPSIKTNDEIKTILHKYCETCIQAIQQILSVKVTVAISQSATSVKHIHYLFEEAKRALSYRNLIQHHQIIQTEQLNQIERQQKYSYPFTLEKEIIHGIRMGLENEVLQLIEHFLQELSTNGSKELIVQQGMLQLLGSIQNNILLLGMNPIEIFQSENLFMQLSQLKESDEMLKWFKLKVVQPLMQHLANLHDLQIRVMVDKVIEHLQSHYMTDYSLEFYAELIGTNPYTLSKAFKQVTGVNFIDYLTGIRMDTAKELLRTTEFRINDVAERVGYRHSYFNRIFKKLEGMTPSLYRELNAVKTLFETH
ncbi:MAG: AraC family transcriptional regulator [Bacilli bacterium]|nr:AraC family transcriptional regulator [Bacilli bacterium]